jgi:hypothetical protein
MSRKHNIFHGHVTKKDGKLSSNNPEKYKLFIDSMEEGQMAEIFLESNIDDGTLTQLAKVHACIRELAKETGYTFEDMKLEIKRQAGLCVKKVFEGENYMVCKSFGDCSKDELSLAVQAIIQTGETVGINFN